jgi:ABC-type nitrate/sulfonate/bicarbonate transport system substrate-binding protein
MLSGDKKVQAEKMGFHVAIDLSQLPIYYPVNGVVASKKFVSTNPEVVENFLKSWLEGIKAFKTDKELSLRVLAKYLRLTTELFWRRVMKYIGRCTRNCPMATTER